MVVPEPELKQVSDDTTQPGSSLNADAVPATNAGRRKLNGKALESTDEYNSKEKQSSGAKKLKQDSDNRPVGLEERHTLSIAETRKRRESVFLDEHLFIPKELARSNLRSSAVNSFSKLSRHKDHRMLKFTVGTGRARHVANQLKKAQMAALQSSSKESPDESELIDGNEVTSYEETKEDEDPMATKGEAIYLPDVDAESAANDPVIHYPVIIDAEEDDMTKEVEDPMAPKEEEGIRMPEMDAANESMIHFEVISDAVEDDNTKEVEDPMAPKEEEGIRMPEMDAANESMIHFEVISDAVEDDNTKEVEDPMAPKEEEGIRMPEMDAANESMIHFEVISDAVEDDNTKEVEDPMAPKEEEGIRMPEMDAANESMIHFEVISDAVEDDNTKEVEYPMATKEEDIQMPEMDAANDSMIHYEVIFDTDNNNETKEVEYPMATKEEEDIHMPEMDAANDPLIHFEVISDAVEDDNTKEVEDPMATKEEDIHMPEMDAANDPLIHFPVIIDTDDVNDNYIKNKSEANEQEVGEIHNPQPMQDQCHSIIEDCTQLVTGQEQPYPYLRWHNPDCELLDVKMGLLEDFQNTSEAEASQNQVENNEQVNTSGQRVEAKEESFQQVQKTEIQQQSQQQEVETMLISNPQHYQAVHQIQQPMVDAQTEPHAHCYSVPVGVSSSIAARSNASSVAAGGNSILCQRLLHHNVLPPVETFLPCRVSHNNSLENFRQQHVDVESLLPSALVYPWIQQNLDTYPAHSIQNQQQQQHLQLQLAQAQAKAQAQAQAQAQAEERAQAQAQAQARAQARAQAQAQAEERAQAQAQAQARAQAQAEERALAQAQAQAQAQARQRIFAQSTVSHIVPQISQQHHQVVCQQNILETIGELEKLKVMQQKLKQQDEEQQRFFYTNLEEIHKKRAEDDHRFQLKMKQSIKAENFLKADKVKQQRKVRAEQQKLDVLIREQQRQLSWRQHQQQLLLQHQFNQQQQQHILQSQRVPQRHHTPMFELPPYIYPPSSSPAYMQSSAAGSEFQAKPMPPSPALKRNPTNSATAKRRSSQAQEAQLRREIDERRATPYPIPSMEIHYPPAATAPVPSTFPHIQFQPIYTPTPPERIQEQRATDHEQDAARANASHFITNFFLELSERENAHK